MSAENRAFHALPYDELDPRPRFPAEAQRLDAADPLAGFRERFHMPRHAGRDALYFTGNSLGLQPVAAAEYIEGELEDWRQFGVEGHFEGRRPWVDYHSFATEDLAYIVGARPLEVVAMNALTVNLHLLLISFYRPEGRRTKLMIEHGAFPERPLCGPFGPNCACTARSGDPPH